MQANRQFYLHVLESWMVLQTSKLIYLWFMLAGNANQQTILPIRFRILNGPTDLEANLPFHLNLISWQKEATLTKTYHLYQTPSFAFSDLHDSFSDPRPI